MLFYHSSCLKILRTYVELDLSGSRYVRNAFNRRNFSLEDVRRLLRAFNRVLISSHDWSSVPATMALDKERERERGGGFLMDLVCLLRKGRSILSVSSYRMSNYASEVPVIDV